MKPVCVVLLLAGLGSSLAFAVPGEAASRNAQAELLDLFSEFCLAAFPDDGAAGQYAAAKGFRTMPEQKLRPLLGDDQGTGWLYETAFGNYAVTIKQPPTHTCTISNQLAKVADIRESFGSTLSLWVGTRHMGSLGVFPPTEQEVSGKTAKVYQWALTRTDGSKETLTATVMPAPDGETEIRLVRSVPDQSGQ